MKANMLALFLFLTSYSFAQEYVKKLQAITFSERYATTLIPRLDSLKLTRRAKDSEVQTIFSRSVDFGFQHHRISVRLNGDYYHINLLTLNDTICFSSVQMGLYFSVDSLFEQSNKKLRFKVDTIRVDRFISLRNKFYGSNKTLEDMIRDLNLVLEVALHCGEGNLETAELKKINFLAKVDKQSLFRQWLNSICCEEQAYALVGYRMLLKNQMKVDKKTMKLVSHVNQRNSPIIQCNGCFIAVN